MQKAQEKQDAGFVTGLYDKSYTVTNMGNDIFTNCWLQPQNGITDTETVLWGNIWGEFDEYQFDEDALSDLDASMFLWENLTVLNNIMNAEYTVLW